MGATHDRAGRRLSRPVGLGPASMPLGARRLVGLGVFVWLIVLAVASLRQEAAGPDWGVRLAPAPDGAGAVVSAVRAQGVGWQVGLRPGDPVRLVDDLDARAFVGRRLGPP